ncbi:hypothetical protein JRQ81_019519 [Phrynocephalus forsythii]|uniref:Ubiquitin carboxyl-terminal hydrolase n=1 Tax=Phrynocephalus forsythii TaxID=171643 RepID=A0A9Q0XMU2_9SAUR|nr:hypothetical protein JRQ81_019519 [Phrynocephalus forsythii]
MDKILEAIVMSSYPDHMKQGLVRRVIEASKQPASSEQCWAMMELSTKLFLMGDTKFKRTVGKEVLETYGLYHKEAFEEFFNVRFLLSLLQEDYGPLGKRSLYVFDYIHLGLPFVLDSPSAEGIVALLRTEVLRKVCERPGLKQCVKISKLLNQHPQCIPTGKRQALFCQQLIRCIGQFRTTSGREEAIVEFLDQVIKVSLLLQKIWKTQMASILPALKELFAIISSTEDREPPSIALASVVQYVPLELMDGILRNLTNDDSITDVQMMVAIGRMIEWVAWPLGKNIDKWIIALLKGLAAVKKFSILIEVTLSKIERVFSKLLCPILRDGALSILRYMLLSFQHSHEAFHLLLPHIPRMVAALKKENSNSAASCLEQLAELVHSMFFRFSGFPDLYEPVVEAIKALPIPNEDRIKHLLGQNAWTSQKNELASFYPRLASKSETGKIGLINLGNTCYMNSIIQALFMASEEEAFTDLSLAFPPADTHVPIATGSASVLPIEEMGPQTIQASVEQQTRPSDSPRRSGMHTAPGVTPALPVETLRPEGQEVSLVPEDDAASAKPQENSGLAWHGPASGPAASRSVPDLINYFLSPETLTAENRYHCENCASLQDAEKLAEVTEGPHYLVLTLLRFSFDLRAMRRKKILDNISVPLVLKLPVLTSSPEEPSGAHPERITGCSASSCRSFASVMYDLCSVVVHSGVSSESGHYYCYARECDGAAEESHPKDASWNPASEKLPNVSVQWYLFNDTRVSFSSFESVSHVTSFLPKDTAYLLFYRQRTTQSESRGHEAVAESGWVNGDLHSPDKSLMEAIAKDNILFLQEQEKEARSRSAYISALPKSPLWWKDFDRDDDDHDGDGSSGGCGHDPGGGGASSFHGLVF